MIYSITKGRTTLAEEVKADRVPCEGEVIELDFDDPTGGQYVVTRVMWILGDWNPREAVAHIQVKPI